MKKIINGRVYETEKAKPVGTAWSNMDDCRNFCHYSEALYRKRTGEYFLYGEGGPSSPYARAIDQNSWSGSEDIRPLTLEEARIWAEKHLDAEEYEAEFGVIVDDETTTQLSLMIKTALVERLRRDATTAGMNLSRYIESILAAHVDR